MNIQIANITLMLLICFFLSLTFLGRLALCWFKRLCAALNNTCEA